MTSTSQTRRALDIDVSELPDVAFHSGSLIWWGTSGMMLAEGTMFALSIMTYFYLRTLNPMWPPPTVRQPTLLLPTINLALLCASVIPFILSDKAAEKGDVGKTRLYLLLGIVAALLFLYFRVLDWRSLNYRWDSHAYGSICWALIIFHTGHVLASSVETMVILALTYFKPLEGHIRVDIQCDTLYWWFIVLAWVPIYIIVYVLPHLHGNYLL